MKSITRYFIQTLHGSTLIEALIAMVVVMVSFGALTAVYVHAIGSSDQVNQLRIRGQVEQVANETKQNSLFIDQDLKFENITIQKKVTVINDRKDVLKLNIIAINPNGKPIYKYHELIRAQ